MAASLNCEIGCSTKTTHYHNLNCDLKEKLLVFSSNHDVYLDRTRDQIQDKRSLLYSKYYFSHDSGKTLFKIIGHCHSKCIYIFFLFENKTYA